MDLTQEKDNIIINYFIFYFTSLISLVALDLIFFYLLTVIYSTNFTGQLYEGAVQFFIMESFIFSFLSFVYYNKSNEFLKKKVFLFSSYFVVISTLFVLGLLLIVIGPDAYTGWGFLIPFYTFISIIPAILVLGFISKFITKSAARNIKKIIITIFLGGIFALVLYYGFIGGSFPYNIIWDIKHIFKYKLIKLIMSTSYFIVSIFVGKYLYKLSSLFFKVKQ